eukprot:COSAG06_NODE_236_length_19469_cov_527.058131_2_plen_186_part_00
MVLIAVGLAMLLSSYTLHVGSIENLDLSDSDDGTRTMGFDAISAAPTRSLLRWACTASAYALSVVGKPNGLRATEWSFDEFCGQTSTNGAVYGAGVAADLAGKVIGDTGGGGVIMARLITPPGSRDNTLFGNVSGNRQLSSTKPSCPTWDSDATTFAFSGATTTGATTTAALYLSTLLSSAGLRS